MDEKLKNALDFSNYVITLNNHKRVIFEKYNEAAVFYYNGGKFTINQTLICFCKTLLDLEQEEAILIDDDAVPVAISSIKEFMNKILSTYTTATNNYLTEYHKLIKNRSVAGIVDL
jgi:hypothetical protein